MEIFFASLRHTWKWALRLGVSLVILFALVLSLGRLLLPSLPGYRPMLEQMIGAYLQIPVNIEQLQCSWHGWKPVLQLAGFGLGDPPLVSFQKVLVSLDLPRSLLARQLVLSNIRLEGAHLALERTADSDMRLLTPASGAPLATLQEFANWLFKIRSLDLVAAQLQFNDATGVIPPLLIPDLRLSLRGKETSWRLDLRATLPESLGREIQGAIELRGNPADPANWSMAFYGNGADLVPSGWLPAGHPTGKADLAFWGDWQGRGQLSLLGQAYLQKPTSAQSADKPPALWADLPDVSLDFNYQRDTRGWQWQSDWTGFDKLHKPLAHASAAVTLVSPPDGGPGYLEGNGQNIRLQDLAALGIPWLSEDQRALLVKLAPSGELPELRFRATLQEAPSSLSAPAVDHAPRTAAILCQECLSSAVRTYELSARLKALSIRGAEYIPGLKGLEGTLMLTQDSGRFDLDSHLLQVDATSLLRAPIVLDTLTGSIQWRYEADRLYLESAGLALANNALSARLHGDLTLFNDGTSPLLNLRMDYSNLDVSRARDYLPAAILHPRLAKWLDHALVSGRVPAGELLFRGHIADFPFDQKQGLFETRFQTEDTILDYYAEWPRLEELEAEVVFRNRSFQLTAVAGKIFDADIRQVDARIEDMANGILEIDGQSQQSSATLLRFLRNSPLARKTGNTIAGLEAQGPSKLNLQLSIPLGPRPNRVNGRVEFTESSLSLPAWGFDCKRIQGQLEFTEKGLAAKDIRLLFRGEPMRLDIDTQTAQGNPATRFKLKGHLNARTLLGEAAAGLASSLSGRAFWEIVLTVPDTPPGNSVPYHLDLRSDLKGIAVTLPPPLAKQTTETRTFKALIRPGTANDSRQISLDYAPDARAVLEFSGTVGQLRLSRGEVRIAAGEAKLPDSPGLTVVARLPELSLTTVGKSQLAGFTSWLSTLQIQAGELVIGNQRLQKFELQATNQNGRLTAQFKGESLAGHLSVPEKPTPADPVMVELQHLALQTAGPSSGTPAQDSDLDPRHIPPLRITVQDLQLDSVALGSLYLLTIPQEKGLRLSDLKLQSELLQIAANGEWIANRQSQTTRLEAELHSPDLGKTLHALGYAVALERGKTEAKLSMDWPGSWSGFSPALVNGKLSVHIGRGQLPDVQPGVGRVFGLFNLGSLSRRLALDFSDIFRQGLSFDRVDGSFTLRQGNAYTDDLMLRGPSAHIHISGRIGLKDRDYDQIITVRPQVGSSLSVAGAIAGGPIVGAAVFLAENLLKRQIEQAASYRYSMTGPWHEPVLQRLMPYAVSTPLANGGDK